NHAGSFFAVVLDLPLVCLAISDLGRCLADVRYLDVQRRVDGIALEVERRAKEVHSRGLVLADEAQVAEAELVVAPAAPEVDLAVAVLLDLLLQRLVTERQD